MADHPDIELLYDRECPVCSFYSQRIDLADGDLERLDARQPGALRDELTALGYDLDEGMVLRIGDKYYCGSDALNQVARLSSRRGFFNRFISFAFRRPRVARALYPVLTRCRALLLRLLGRGRIDNLSAER